MRRFTILSALVLAHTLGAVPRTTPLADTARFLAGLEPAPDSPLARFRKHDAWLHFRQSIGKKWAHYDKVCTAEIRKWAAVWMPKESRSFLFYPFAGGDFINAHLFYPRASTILMIGLEPAGRVPELTALGDQQLRHGLYLLDEGFRIFSTWNFYRTLGMRHFMFRSPFTGTVPHILAQMARLGIRPLAVYSVAADPQGKLHFTEVKDDRIHPHLAVDYEDRSGTRKRVISLQLDLRDPNLQRQKNWRLYLQGLGKTDGFMKAASCLLPRRDYVLIRKIILDTMQTIVQDDSCMPYRLLKDGWQITLFGSYLRAHYLFPSFTQPDLRAAYRTAPKRDVPFPFTYERPDNRRNLQLCIKK